MYIAHTANLFFSPVDSEYVMFALSPRDKTNRSTETSILYCYNGTIKREKRLFKTFLCSCVLVLLLLLSVVIVAWSCFFFFFSDSDNAATSDFFFVFPHPLGKTKQNKQKKIVHFTP